MQVRPPAPILPLTSVRFLAALYVVLYHSNLWQWHIDQSTWLGKFLFDGNTAVGFFFILSGFILAFVYLDTSRRFDRRAFWTARFARAYPLLLLSIVLDAPNLYSFLAARQGWVEALKTTALGVVSGAALLQAWAGRFREINLPSWSLSAEAFFYLAFPFLAFRVWRNKGRRALLTIFLLWLLTLAVPVATTLRLPELFPQQPHSVLQLNLQLNPVLRLFEFLAGVALCSFHRSFQSWETAAGRSRVGVGCIFLSAMLFVLVIQETYRIPFLVMNSGALFPSSCLLILGLANLEGTAARMLSHRRLVLLGEASYAVYLLHTPVWNYLSRFFPVDTPVRWVLFLSLLLALSVASFLYVERPARRRILALTAVRPAVTLQQESVAPG